MITEPWKGDIIFISGLTLTHVNYIFQTTWAKNQIIDPRYFDMDKICKN